jgi:hypothetical protein
MGRTYKRNDDYRSNRPKSLREKRAHGSRKQSNWSEYQQLDQTNSDTNRKGKNYQLDSEEYYQ